MDTSSNNKKIYFIVGGAIVVVIAAVAVGYLLGTSKNGVTGNSGTVGAGGAGAGTNNPQSATYANVPTGIQVVGQNATNTAKDIAVPKVVIPAAPGVSASLRVFDISGNNGVFSPSTVTAYVGDTVHVNFTAVDKPYDITFPDYSMKQTAQKGETKVLEFQATTAGKFTYYCDSCGGLKSNAVGYMIIVPKG